MPMYVNPFVAGFVSCLLIICVSIVIAAIIKGRKRK